MQVQAVRVTRPLDQCVPLARVIQSKGRLRQTWIAVPIHISTIVVSD